MTQEDIVHLTLSCLNLPSECAQGVRIAISGLLEDGITYVEIGQTETLIGHINPNFERNIPLVVRLDINQMLKFYLYLINGETEIISGKFGEAEVNLLTLLTSSGQLALPLHLVSNCEMHESSPPFIIASAYPSENSSRGTVLQFAGESLRPESKLQVAPYFTMELLPSAPEKMPILLYRSEALSGNENPRWKEFTIPTNFFPSTSDWSLQLSCYNFNNNAEDLLLGRCSTTFYQLINTHGTNKFILRKGVKKKGDSILELVRVQSKEDTPSFINMIKCGLQLHFTVAVDFTANNGGPNSVDSLHYIHPHVSNAYMDAISEIIPSLSKFDKLERVSFLGFGAKVPPTFELSHLFALNGDLNNPHVKGTSEALHYYRNNAISLMPFAPTQYSSAIHHVIKLAKAAVRSSVGFYFVVVILTNGAIRDLRDTVDTIVQASDLPISIVFVAVGNSKFPVGAAGDISKLERLLSPTLKSSSNAPLRRETVSLVVNNFEHLPMSSGVSVGGQPTFLARRVLVNIPRQMTLWALKSRTY